MLRSFQKLTTVLILIAICGLLPLNDVLHAHSLNPTFFERITGQKIKAHPHPEEQSSVKSIHGTSHLTTSERQEVLSEFPEYGTRKIEQTYLTLPEWYQVYTYNEFSDYLMQGGGQKDFPFLGAIKDFWSYYRLALNESKDENFNWGYNFVNWMIGANLSIEYFIKFTYENTVGAITQLLSEDNTEVDIFIANSWNDYAKRMYQTTWYHYPYFDDLKDIWKETSLQDRNFVRNLERKISFSTSYLLKGSYAKAWLLTANEKDNETLSLVYTANQESLENNKVEILKTFPENKYLIKTDRYMGFKDAMLQLLESNVQFLEIQGHEVISLSYLSGSPAEPFHGSGEIKILDKRELFYNPDGYSYRVTLKTPVQNLSDVIETITANNGEFEMIYDF